MPELPERTALYRIRNADGDLLYIGISETPEFRWISHRRNHAWWADVTDYSLEWHENRQAAEAAEAEAVRAEGPLYNSTYNYEVPFDPAIWAPVVGHNKHDILADRIRSEIHGGRWLPGRRIPSFETLAEASSVGRHVAKKAVNKLRDEGLLVWKPGEDTYVKLSA